jgi:magnesium transporter
MLDLYTVSNQGLQQHGYSPTGGLPRNAVWIDMVQPSREEEQAVESALHIDVPTREEIREIEASSRQYKKTGMMFMTATVLCKADTLRPETTEVTFILAAARLITSAVRTGTTI